MSHTAHLPYDLLWYVKTIYEIYQSFSLNSWSFCTQSPAEYDHFLFTSRHLPRINIFVTFTHFFYNCFVMTALQNSYFNSPQQLFSPQYIVFLPLYIACRDQPLMLQLPEVIYIKVESVPPAWSNPHTSIDQSLKTIISPHYTHQFTVTSWNRHGHNPCHAEFFLRNHTKNIFTFRIITRYC